jgi:formylglycine-generating enzyme required for sulfatase activity/predicted GH43/DUF377 family glycosyl hydrolase
MGLLICAACGTAQQAEPTITGQVVEFSPIYTPEVTHTPAHSPTPTISPTFEPTATATSTLEPTRTPKPAQTATKIPQVIFRMQSAGKDSILPVSDSQILRGPYTDPGGVVYHDGQFHMFYNNLQDYPPTQVAIGYAASSDGLEWARVTEHSVLDVRNVPYGANIIMASSALVEEDGTWVLYFNTVAEEGTTEPLSVVGRATASSPTGPWRIDPQPVLEPDPDGWDAYAIQRPSVVRTADGYYMYYQALESKCATPVIGMATSPDGMNWTKYPNPIFEGSAVTWGEHISARYPYVVKTDLGWFMFFHASGDKFPQSIGLAVSSDGINWVLGQDQPVFQIANYPAWSVIFVDKVVHVDGTWYLFLETENLSKSKVNLATFKGELIPGENIAALPPPAPYMDSFGVPMVHIPAGEFRMGSESGGEDAQPHQVYLDNYYIDQYEVTNEQFASFLNEVGNLEGGDEDYFQESSDVVSIFKEGDNWVVETGFENHPVVEVSWFGASAFCNWRGARLPSEAEWEKAAKGEEGHEPFPWGKGIKCSIVNYGKCGIGAPLPVDSFPEGVSPYGVLNLAGNVAEWTADWYGEDYYTNSPFENPQGPTDSSDGTKSSRGGSWYSAQQFLKTYHRNNEFAPFDTLGNVGFRCVR